METIENMKSEAYDLFLKRENYIAQLERIQGEIHKINIELQRKNADIAELEEKKKNPPCGGS
jgi:hypothetical protein